MRRNISPILTASILLVFLSCQPEERIIPANGALVNLNVSLKYPELETYDSAIIVFKNSTGGFNQKLSLDNSTHIATGHITNIPLGEWKVSTSYYSTLYPNYESLENMGVVDLQISSTATDLISDEKTTVYVTDDNDPVHKTFQWVDYYHYQLYLKNKSEGFVRLPKDPTNPFIEIYTYTQKWVYGYFDRAFYNSSLDGVRNFYQGSAAGEIYGTMEQTKDRLEKDIIDNTSLVPGIESVKNKIWNRADGLVLLADYDGNEIVLYHVWDLRTDDGGRIKPNPHLQIWSKAKIEDRKRNSLH